MKENDNSARVSANQKVVHISKAKRVGLRERPDTHPALEVPLLWVVSVCESNRAVMVEADLLADIRLGDLNQTALRKARYVIENVHGAFQDDAAIKELVGYMISVVELYGEPEGVSVLETAWSLFGCHRELADQMALAVSRIGSSTDLPVLIRALEADVASKACLGALEQFVDRFPDMRPGTKESLRRSLVPESVWVHSI